MIPTAPEESVLNWIRHSCLPSDSVLDIGCGEGRYKDLSVEDYVGLDSWPACNPSFLIDLNNVDIPFPDDSFDIVLMIDFIEHLSKRRSRQLIAQAQDICKREVLLMTPVFWDSNKDALEDFHSVHYNNLGVVHKSHWNESDFKSPGWIKEKLYSGKIESKTSKEMLVYRWMK